jgi:hypothetical protein
MNGRRPIRVRPLRHSGGVGTLRSHTRHALRCTSRLPHSPVTPHLRLPHPRQARTYPERSAR